MPVDNFDKLCVDALEKHLQRKSTIEDWKDCALIYNRSIVLLIHKNKFIGSLYINLCSSQLWDFVPA